MLVRMLAGLAGPRYVLLPNDERDFPQDEAIRLISAGFAVPAQKQEIELAVAEPAAERRSRKGRRNVVSRGGDNGAAN